MTRQQAETFANVAIGVAALGAVYLVARTPSLRRLAWNLARTAVLTSGPAWLAAEARRGWNGTGPRPLPPSRPGASGGGI